MSTPTDSNLAKARLVPRESERVMAESGPTILANLNMDDTLNLALMDFVHEVDYCRAHGLPSPADVCIALQRMHARLHNIERAVRAEMEPGQ